jgi:hypothetical protein
LGYYIAKKPANNKYDFDLDKLEESDPLFDELEADLRRRGNLRADLKQGPLKMKQKNRIELPPSYHNVLRLPLEKNKIYFGDDVYLYQNHPNFHIRHPLKHGLFNISKGYSHEQIATDLE